MSKQKTYSDIQAYIDTFPEPIQNILLNLRMALSAALPDAVEQIRYNMPAFQSGGAVVYFAAFKNHIGFFPPVRGDDALNTKLQRYRGEKGNLQFPLSEPIPYPLIQEVAERLIKEYKEYNLKNIKT